MSEPKIKFRKFKCLPKIEVSEIIDWDKPYSEIEIPEGLRLINIYELITLLESEEEYKFLGKYKNKFNYFWIEQRKWDKKNDTACRVDRNDNGNWDADWYNLDNSSDCGRVVFVKEATKQ